MANRPEHPFSAPYASPDETVAAVLLAGALRAPRAEQSIDQRAKRLIQGIRAKAGGLGGIPRLGVSRPRRRGATRRARP